jgi:hypothetical protein
MAEKSSRWSKADDKKLAELFRTPRNKVDPEDLSIEAVKEVHKRYFKQFKYQNFAPLYRDKARAWNVNRSLEGHRRSKKEAAKPQHAICLFVAKLILTVAFCWPCMHVLGSQATKAVLAGKNTKKSISLEDSEDSSNEGEDEEEGGDEEEDVEDNDEEDSGEEEDMVKTPPRKPKPTTKAKALPKPRFADVDDLAYSVSRMKVDPGYSMDFAFPHVIYTYQRDGVDYCSVDMLVPPLLQASFKPFVSDDLSSVRVDVKLPRIFIRKNRLLQADENLDENNTKAAAFERQCQIIKENFDFADEIIGKNPYTVATPFKVEPAIVEWEVLYFPNQSEELTDLVGQQQFYAVLTMELRSVEKPKQRRAGRGRVIGVDPDPDEQPQAMQQDDDGL